MNKQKGIAEAMQSGRFFQLEAGAIATLRVTVYDKNNTRREAVLRLDSEELAQIGDVLLADSISKESADG